MDHTVTARQGKACDDCLAAGRMVFAGSDEEDGEEK